MEEEPKLFRIKCKKCLLFLSYPFKPDFDLENNNEDIKLPRYKGDNINYHAENNFFKKDKILYSYIFCLRCHEEIGYWISQASVKQKENINQLFFFQQHVILEKYDKKDVTEEEDKKFKQEEIFYNSQFLTKEVEDFAKEHIDNFIRNVEILERERNDSRLCYQSFDRKILTLKKLFIFNMKDRENAYHLGIDFSKEENSNEKRRNKSWDVSHKNDNGEDSKDKRNEKKDLNIKNDDGKNSINEDNYNNGKGNKKNISSDNNSSDIYLSHLSKESRKETLKNNNNKEPTKIKGNNRNKSKESKPKNNNKKRKRK
jgi:hypothetical protein